MLRSRTEKGSDIVVRDEGSIVLVTPATHESECWLREHTDGTWFGGGLVVEHRYAADLLQGAVDEGFRLGRDA
jgi:hypothetical protein